MPRAAAALFAVSIALACPLAAVAAGAGNGHRADVTGTILLRARVHRGPWKSSLSLKLVKLRLISFSLCAIWNHQPGETFDCDIAAQSRLPTGTSLRLEQNPVAKAVKRADSPGWGMLGLSGDGALGAVLSNEITGNRRGTFHYRVTLRDSENRILVTSNTFTLVWY